MASRCASSTAGYPAIPGATLSPCAAAREHQDRCAGMLMFEPRGHSDMYGVLVKPDLTGRRSRRAVPAQRGLSHHVRPRGDRARSLGGGSGNRAAPAGETRVESNAPAAW